MKYLQRIPLIVCVGLGITHLWASLTFGVDLPLLDEWSLIPSRLTLNWLFAWQNEHRIVASKFLIWILYKINGWDLRSNQCINIFLYVGILVWLFKFSRKSLPKVDEWKLSAFWIFLLSPIIYFNFLWGILSCTQFLFIFLFGGAQLLFDSRGKIMNLVAGTGLLLLLIVSHAGGLVGSCVVISGYSVFWFKKYLRSSTRSGRLWAELLPLLPVLSVAGMWFLGYQKPLGHPSMMFPLAKQFWNHYLNLLSFGFGFKNISFLPGFFCFLIIVIPVLGLLLWHDGKFQPRQWISISLTLSFLAIIAFISLGRSGFGVSQSKISRYSEYGLLLIPFVLINWSDFIGEKSRLKFYAGICFWLFLFGSFLGEWRYFGKYRQVWELSSAELECASKFYRNEERGLCSSTLWTIFEEHFAEAKSSNLSFYRKLAGRVEHEANS